MTGYRPTTLEIPMLKRLGADFFRANISFNDHPFDRRMAGLIDTVTVESVVAFVQQRDPVSDGIDSSIVVKHARLVMLPDV